MTGPGIGTREEAGRVRTAPAAGRLGLEARAARAVLTRELIRVVNNDLGRVLSMVLMSLMWLFVIGDGIGTLMPITAGGVELKTFMFPGVLAMSVISTAMISATSLVWDQESGFVREMLVAPISRTAIVVGKILGGALLATFQTSIVLAFAGAAGVPYDPLLLLNLFGLMLLAAFTISALAVLIATRTKRMESFQGATQLAIMPLVFLSGALFPLGDLPGWLTVLTRINPLTYAVDPMRNAVFDHLGVSDAVNERFNPGVDWFGWTVPVSLEVTVLGIAGALFTWLAVRRLAASS